MSSKAPKPSVLVQQVGLLTAIPFVLGSGPLLGWWIGQWLDKKFGTGPLCLVIGLLIGVGASTSQVGRLVRFFNKNGDR